MKKIFAFSLVIAFSIFSACQKQATDAERQAEIDREVQRRLESERQAQERQQLAQRQADVDAREKALAEKENAAARNPERATPSVRTEQRATRTEDRQATASYETFYTRLEPQGVWRETSTYGYVWQPREAQQSRNWRPYTNGHWVYTDAGWTWVSEEPFGWATYHYGRWTRLRNIGWVWVPGDEWAPAWVSWRKSNDYVGWAPLPPEARFDRGRGIHKWADSYYDIGPDQYCFVRTNELSAQRVERVIVPPEQNVTIVNQTTNVTNITYSNTIVINQGPDFEELRSRTQRPIPRLRLERQTNLNVENPHPVVQGEVIQVPAPLIARSQPVERPRSVKETIRETVVDHGWDAIADRQAAEKVRGKIKSEATPPPDAPSKTFVKPAQATAETTTSTPALPSPSPSATVSPAATEAASPPPPVATAASRAPAVSTPRFGSPRPLESISPAPATSARPQLGDTSRISPSGTVSPVPPAASTPIQSNAESPTPPAARRSPTPLGTPLRAATPASPSPASSPEASATVSASPSVSPTISGSASGTSAFGPAAHSRDQREAAKELRKQEKAVEKQQKKERDEQAPTRAHESPANAGSTSSPSNSTSAPATAPASPFPNDARELRKEEKKKQKAEREGTSQPTASVSPSPSMPQ
jgi:hypothetical protein